MPRLFTRSHPAVERALLEARSLDRVVRAGMVRPAHPRRLATGLRGVRRYGPLGGATSLAAAIHGDAIGLTDDDGSLTFRQMEQRANALANAWRADGLRPGDTMALMGRNHRTLFDVAFAAAKLGLRLVLLNTDFGGPQAVDVCAREGVRAVVHDQEFSGVLADVAAPGGRWLAHVDGPTSLPSVQTAIDGASARPPAAPEQPGALVVLTSGTTGPPKGAGSPVRCSTSSRSVAVARP